MENQFKYCECCNKKFNRFSDVAYKYWNKQKFCSIQCSGTLIKKGEPLSPNILNGTYQKYRRLHEQIQNGDKNYNWKGGISNHFLRKSALLRDNYTCIICGHREPEIMEVDHIKPKSKFPELAKDIKNLVTLCPNCHRRKTNRELSEAGKNSRRVWIKSLDETVAQGFR